MAVLEIGGMYFKIRPETVSWAYSMNIQSFDTFAGRVVQLLSCKVDSFTVEGYIAPRRTTKPKADNLGIESDVASQWIAMRNFEDHVKAIMDYHEEYKVPLTISFKGAPELGWSLAGEENKAYLVGYTDVRYEPDIPAARYTLKFEVDSGFSGIEATVSEEALAAIKNIPDGVGWVSNKYNTPEINCWEKVKDAIGKIVDDAGTHDSSKPADFFTYLQEAFGVSEESSGKTTNGSKDVDYTDPANVPGVAGTVVGAGISLLQSLGMVPIPDNQPVDSSG